MFICTYAIHTAFYVCFQLQIHRHTWFTVVLLISLMLFVITCTCILGPHHLIMHTCACYAHHLALLYVLTGLRLTTLDLMSRSYRPDLGGLAIADQSAQRILPWRSECSRSLDYHRSSSSQFISCLVLETPLAAREHLFVSSYDVVLYFLVM